MLLYFKYLISVVHSANYLGFNEVVYSQIVNCLEHLAKEFDFVSEELTRCEIIV